MKIKQKDPVGPAISRITQSREHGQPPHSRVSSAGRNRLSSSPIAARPRRLIMFYRREGFGLSLAFDLGENAFQHFYEGREADALRSYAAGLSLY
jgi:hypothetical protein